jgi:hypothetical protein
MLRFLAPMIAALRTIPLDEALRCALSGCKTRYTLTFDLNANAISAERRVINATVAFPA